MRVFYESPTEGNEVRFVTLPPVVSDPELCPDSGTGLHDWRKVMVGDFPEWDHQVCRYCGGRKP